jgi:iduronate 2-sulfatase
MRIMTFNPVFAYLFNHNYLLILSIYLIKMKRLLFFIMPLIVGCIAASTSTPKTVASTATQNAAPLSQYNILFIAVDDLKPDIASFGFKETKTPNIDKLAQASTIFNGNYCQQAVCAPTRASLLTGLRPDKTQVWDLQTLIRAKNPDVTTLPQYLKANGYNTMAMGKIFDPRSVDKDHDAVSWTVPYKNKFKYPEGYEDIVVEAYQSPEMKARFKELQAQRGAKNNDKNEDFDNPKITRKDILVSTESADVPDDAYFDGAMTKYAIQQLKAQKGATQPFFMAVGFHKPHLPFVAPKKYWDLYDRSKVSLAKWQKPSIDGPDIAYHNAGEMRGFKDIEKLVGKPKNGKDLLNLPEAKQRELIHGYYACISYLDAQVGKLMDALKAEGLDKNTIIVLWGDHGWHLGDHSLWCKHSNFEQATKAPLMFTVPNLTKGKVYTNPTEFVDIFPTLCELTGLAIPTHLDGKSLVPAMKDNTVKVKDFAISQYPRGGGGGESRNIMGYSMRTERYRYTEWLGSKFTTAQPFNEKLVTDMELYDLVNDPDETTNLANKADMKKQVKELATQLRAYYSQQYATAGKIK